jgi:hypothetical protein
MFLFCFSKCMCLKNQVEEVIHSQMWFISFHQGNLTRLDMRKGLISLSVLH